MNCPYLLRVHEHILFTHHKAKKEDLLLE